MAASTEQNGGTRGGGFAFGYADPPSYIVTCDQYCEVEI